MGVTGKKELETPILDILADGKEWERMDLVDELASRLNLTDAELSEGLRAGDVQERKAKVNCIVMLIVRWNI